MVCRLLSFTAVGLLALAGMASAATKITPALQKNSGDSFVCRVVNANTGPLSVEIDIISNTGAVLAHQSVVNTPGGWTSSESYNGTSPIAYCKVSGSFSKKKTLVTLCVLQSGSSLCQSPVGDPGL